MKHPKNASGGTCTRSAKHVTASQLFKRNIFQTTSNSAPIPAPTRARRRSIRARRASRARPATPARPTRVRRPPWARGRAGRRAARNARSLRFPAPSRGRRLRTKILSYVREPEVAALSRARSQRELALGVVQGRRGERLDRAVASHNLRQEPRAAPMSYSNCAQCGRGIYEAPRLPGLAVVSVDVSNSSG